MKRRHAAYLAFVAHRVSGLALAVFLPVHFWALGRAIEGEARLDAFLRWADDPLVKAAETVLVALLAIHLAGGVRLLLLEFAGLADWRGRAAAGGAGFGLFMGLLFVLNLGA